MNDNNEYIEKIKDELGNAGFIANTETFDKILGYTKRETLIVEAALLCFAKDRYMKGLDDMLKINTNNSNLLKNKVEQLKLDIDNPPNKSIFTEILGDIKEDTRRKIAGHTEKQLESKIEEIGGMLAIIETMKIDNVDLKKIRKLLTKIKEFDSLIDKFRSQSQKIYS